MESDRLLPLEPVPLSLAFKIFYGLPMLPLSFLIAVWGTFTFDYWNVYCRIPVPVTNLGLTYAVVVALILLPFTGPLMDRTNSRWGRRKPWIPTSFLAFAICQILLFIPPTDLPHWILSSLGEVTFHTLYFALLYCVLVVALVWLNSPAYIGFGWEMTDDFDDRRSLFAWMQAFQVIGSIGGMASPPLLESWFPDQRNLFLVLNLSFGAAGFLSFLPLLIWIPERPPLPRPSPPVVTEIKLLFHSRPSLVFLLACNVLTWAPTFAQYLPFWIQTVVGASKPEQAFMLVVPLGATLVATPAWHWLASTRLGKRGAWMVALLLGALGYLGFLLPAFHSFWFALTVVFVTGFAMMPTPWNNFLVQSIQGDVIDYDEFMTGLRREALYFSASQYVNWLLSPLSSNLPFWLMSQSGFDSDSGSGPAPASVAWTLRGIMAAGALFALAACLLWLAYPLNRVKHRQVLEGIKAHRRGESALDPVTNQPVFSLAGKSPEEMQKHWALLAFAQAELRWSLRRTAADQSPVGLAWLVLVQFLFCLLLVAGLILVWIFIPSSYWIAGYALVVAVHAASLSFLRFSLARSLPTLGVRGDDLAAFLSPQNLALN